MTASNVGNQLLNKPSPVEAYDPRSCLVTGVAYTNYLPTIYLNKWSPLLGHNNPFVPVCELRWDNLQHIWFLIWFLWWLQTGTTYNKYLLHVKS